jgi:hypothetical protein
MSGMLYSHIGPLFTLMVLKRKICYRMDDDINLRPGGATSGKCSIFWWEGRGVVCRYSELQGGSPCLCQLRTVRSGTLSELSICTDRMLALWDPVNWCSLVIVVVGWYSTIPLEMFSGIVYGPPTDSPASGIAWKTCTRERWDLHQPYDVIMKGFHMWPV